MKHNTGRSSVQRHRLIVSVSMFSRLPIVNKVDIIRSFFWWKSIASKSACDLITREVTFTNFFSSGKTIKHNQGTFHVYVSCNKIQGLILVTLLGQQLTWVANHKYKCSEIWDDDKFHSSPSSRHQVDKWVWFHTLTPFVIKFFPPAWQSKDCVMSVIHNSIGTKWYCDYVSLLMSTGKPEPYCSHVFSR